MLASGYNLMTLSNSSSDNSCNEIRASIAVASLSISNNASMPIFIASDS